MARSSATPSAAGKKSILTMKRVTTRATPAATPATLTSRALALRMTSRFSVHFVRRAAIAATSREKPSVLCRRCCSSLPSRSRRSRRSSGPGA